MAAFVEQQIEGEGLCLGDFMVLEVLLHKGPLTLSTIGEKVLLTNASMTSAADRLEKKRLVVRTNCKEDRRVRLVHLTPQGRKVIAEIYRRHARELEEIMTGLPAAERAGLYRGLKTIGLAAEAASKKGQKKGSFCD
jgi:MarR family 2-MHQ and catechol resistance regulon transcriptional repressor